MNFHGLLEVLMHIVYCGYKLKVHLSISINHPPADIDVQFQMLG